MMSPNRDPPTPKKRESRAGTRKVTSLSAEQLERKRANDREAQRTIRQRTKEHIESLEHQVAELTAKYQRYDDVVRQNSALQDEIKRLRHELAMMGGARQAYPDHCMLCPGCIGSYTGRREEEREREREGETEANIQQLRTIVRQDRHYPPNSQARWDYTLHLEPRQFYQRPVKCRSRLTGNTTARRPARPRSANRPKPTIPTEWTRTCLTTSCKPQPQPRPQHLPSRRNHRRCRASARPPPPPPPVGCPTPRPQRPTRSTTRPVTRIPPATRQPATQALPPLISTSIRIMRAMRRSPPWRIMRLRGPSRTHCLLRPIRDPASILFFLRRSITSIRPLLDRRQIRPSIVIHGIISRSGLRPLSCLLSC